MLGKAWGKEETSSKKMSTASCTRGIGMCPSVGRSTGMLASEVPTFESNAGQEWPGHRYMVCYNCNRDGIAAEGWPGDSHRWL